MDKYTQAIHELLRYDFPPQIIQRGRRVFDNDNILDIKINSKAKSVVAKVQSENYYWQPDPYNVTIIFDKRKKEFNHECTCPYGYACKHTVAVLMLLSIKLSDRSLNFEIDPKNVTIALKNFSDKEIKKKAGLTIYNNAVKLLEESKPKAKLLKPGEMLFMVKPNGIKYIANIQNQKNSNEITTTCNCNDTENILCEHKTAACLEAQSKYGKYGLFFTHDYSQQLENILKQIGLSLDDNYHKVIDLKFTDDNLSAIVNNPNFLTQQNFNYVKDIVQHNPFDFIKDSALEEFITGYVFEFTGFSSQANSISFGAIIGKKAKRSDKIIGSPDLTSMPLDNPIWKNQADNNDYEIAKHLDELKGFNISDNFSELANKLSILKTLVPNCINKKLFALRTNQYDYSVKASQLVPIQISSVTARAKIICNVKGPFIQLNFEYYIGSKEIKLNNLNDNSYFLVEQKETIHLWQSIYHFKAYVISNGSNELLIAKTHWDQAWEEWLRELANHIQIEINNEVLNMSEVEVKSLQAKVFLKEQGNFLLIYPAMAYNSIDVHILQDGPNHISKDNSIIKRDREKEIEFIEKIAATHDSFNKNTFQPFFYYPADKVLERMWFINFYETCKKENIEVFGIENLKKIKYYPARPKVNYSFSSGTDWFDVEMKLEYDDIQVSLKEVRKAILNKQDFVKLSNDKLAMLPEDWLERFKTAIRFGKITDDGIRLKKSQFALVHDLYEEINDLELQKEFAENRILLSEVKEIEKIRKPKIINAQLRDYQAEGLNWLGFLFKAKLGGCLADDMGLGKTLQMLAVFAYAKGQAAGKKVTNLVVCPTSLIYNWKNEIEKFAPKLKPIIHWGNNREKESSNWKNQDIIITTYGTLTNDIEWIRKFKFNIAVLDESQAIKNPGSLRYKAACLIQAQRRFVMTGTPIENSTTELYAQMHFINPGMLGSLNAFRKDFSANIEKDQDEQKIHQLRKLVKPFILRRFKEDVAKELPPKTEQVLICEMSEEQKNVYNAFKKDIYDKIMTSIDTEGINKSRLTVLEGLTRLRQICDSPALLNTEENYGKSSVKADELIRFITQKIRNHKALIFSQFLGMLSLIEERLEEEGIKYLKLTGSTRNRQELVDQFENNDEYQVFLISLKAGGVGLNLVSADYVFMVDPWWNPAVENQAIDRAHRIGQTKSVFAYRMICKDTIEEKILSLKEQKQALADDLINSEQGFVTQLTKEDINNLLN